MSKQAVTCDSEFDPLAKTVDQAIELILSATHTLNCTETLFLREAFQRVIAEPVVAHFAVPPHRNSAMDGYAVNHADLDANKDTTCLTVIGKSLAGHPFEGHVGVGECVRIMTGAVMPEGTDTSVMQEHVTQQGSLATFPSHQTPGQNVRHPGEDMKPGDVILDAGRRLTAADLGLLASQGITEVSVYRQPRVAFFSTGDELKSLGETLASGDIYDSNRYTLHGMLQKLGVSILDMGVIPDDAEAVQQAFTRASENADMVITTGGVSVGEADYITNTLETLGEVNFWKIAMKPGRPLAFGKVGKALFFGLPGNPVSTMATFVIFVRPALKAIEGEPYQPAIKLRATLEHALKKTPGRTDFQRGIYRFDDGGQLVVNSTGIQGSHMLRSMSQANCFIVLPRESGNIDDGSEVDIMPFDGLLV
ncbi:MAG: molybdopterin molybdotransferase MoeA [bacterium]